MAPENRSTSSSASSSDNQSESEEIVDKRNVTDSESEEDEEEQSGDENEEEEGEKTIAQTKAQLQTQNQKPQSSSGDDNSSGSDSDSDSDSRERTPSPTVSAFAVKPISSKTLDKPQKPTPKPSAPEPKPGTKRPAKVQNGNDGSSKNKKMKVEEEKKTNYRLWSEDDEVAIMKGVLDFKNKRGADAFADMGAFYEFVKNEFTVAVTKNQLLDKARRLKKKYQPILEKKRVNGEDPVFQKPVEHKCFQLSEKIWGTDSLDSSAKNPPSRRKKVTTTTKSPNALAATKHSNAIASPLPLPEKKKSDLEKKSNGVVEDGKPVEDDFYSMFPALKGSLEAKDMNLSVPEAVVNAVKKTIPLIGTVKAKELEDRWKNLEAEQTRLFLKQLDLVREQTKMALDAMEASKQ